MFLMAPLSFADNGVSGIPVDDPVLYRIVRKVHMWDMFRQVSGCDDTTEVKPRQKHRLTPGQGRLVMEYLSSQYDDLESWEIRRRNIRKDLYANMGLDKIDTAFQGRMISNMIRPYTGYTVRNFALEILPGVFCTGSIYHPASCEGKLPLLLNPHGHYEGGRCHPIVQSRCAAFALMGCVSVCYDMFAYGVYPQFDPQYHKTSLAQPYNMLCAKKLLDYFLSLEQIDSSRVGITGSSGGGSQAFFAVAIDDRITLSMPVVMVSSASFGGCPCESGTNVHFSGGFTNNVELAALCAPRPMLLISDGADWTRYFPMVDYPHIERVYGFYGAQDKVMAVHFPDEVHDYGPSKRKAAYEFLAKHWQLDLAVLTGNDGCLDESRCVIEEPSLMNVWKDSGMPSDAVTSVRDFARMIGWITTSD